MLVLLIELQIFFLKLIHKPSTFNFENYFINSRDE